MYVYEDALKNAGWKYLTIMVKKKKQDQWTCKNSYKPYFPKTPNRFAKKMNFAKFWKNECLLKLLKNLFKQTFALLQSTAYKYKFKLSRIISG